MVAYSLNFRENKESRDRKIMKLKNGRIILLSKCAVYDSKKSKFIKEQKANGFLSSFT